jgi:hypothetical protein
MLGRNAAVRVDLAKRPAGTRRSFGALAPPASGGLALRTQAEFRRHRPLALHFFPEHLDPLLRSHSVPSDDRSSASADPHFLPVTILADPIPSIAASQPHLELIRSHRRRIAVPLGFDPRTLRLLIAVGEERPCLD